MLCHPAVPVRVGGGWGELSVPVPGAVASVGRWFWAMCRCGRGAVRCGVLPGRRRADANGRWCSRSGLRGQTMLVLRLGGGFRADGA